MLAAAGKTALSLDIPGKPRDTPQLAAELERWKLDGRDVSLLIGGPEGLSPACKSGGGAELVAVGTPSPSAGSRAGRRESVPGVEHHHQPSLITVSDK